MNVVCCLKLYQTCKITFAIGVTEDLTERDLGLSQKAPRMNNIAFINMANEVKKETEERYTAYVEKYQADGFTLKQAKEESVLVTLQGDRQVMFKKYVAFLKLLFSFNRSELHRSIVRAIKEELDKSGDRSTAIRNILRKRKMVITDFVAWVGLIIFYSQR